MARLVEAVLFDLDGVLANTEGPDGLHNVAWNASLEMHSRHLIDITDQATERMEGRRPLEIARIMVEDLRLTTVDPEVLLQEKTDIFNDSVQKGKLRPMQYARGTVRRLHEAGYPLAVVTSTEYAEAATEKFGIRDYIDVIVTGSMVEHGKPAPDSYLKAAKLLGVKPSQSVVVEDLPNGVAAGLAAGAVVVGVFNRKALQDLSGAHVRISSLRPVTPQFVERVARQRTNS